MKTADNTVNFQDISASDGRIYALDFDGQLWCAELTASDRPFPVEQLRWKRCAMPIKES